MRSLVLLVLLAAVVRAIHVPGTLETDVYSFPKLAAASNLLVVFQAQSWKEIHKFDQVAKELRDRDDILVVRLDGSSDRDQSLKEKYGVTSLPSVFFLAKGSSSPVFYTGALETGASPEALVQWVRIQLTPSLSALADIAKKFSAASISEQRELLSRAQQVAKGLQTAQDIEIGKIYTRTLEKIQHDGAEYVTKEKARLNGLIENKATTQQKKDEFQRRLTILESFVQK